MFFAEFSEIHNQKLLKIENISCSQNKKAKGVIPGLHLGLTDC